MKKKIRKQLILIAVLSVVLTMLSVLLVFYHVFTQQVKHELRDTAHILGTMENREPGSISEQDYLTEELRITILDEDGSVLYDSTTDYLYLANHGGRPEVKDALETGEGYAVRRSDTFSENAYYYAVKLNNGGILRVSRQASNIFSVFLSTIPVMAITGAAVVFLCVLVAGFLTRSLIGYIEKMAENVGNNDENIHTYSELKPFVETINRQHEAIIKNARIRQEFTANVSHELKTPLTVISGYSELIENGMASDADVVRFAKEIHKNSSRLLVLINDILRLSELDTESLKATYEPVDLYDVAKDCVSMLTLKAKDGNISILLKGQNALVNGDRRMLEEMLYNLVDNGIRYNEPGGSVTIDIEEKKEEILLSVSDTGIGISPEHRERIFERFYRVDKSRSRETGGTGLGLAIVKHIVENTDASLSLESEPGKGTCIRIIFPKTTA
ncbi:MAG: two-component sensor histidine kinase [Lachnospiraceae bacterium]|nr:two-component sensor histidine kinase [Lachnospiraceae bacterium]